MDINKIEIIVETDQGTTRVIFIRPDKIQSLMDGKTTIQDFILDII